MELPAADSEHKDFASIDAETGAELPISKKSEHKDRQ
jgi:hypothetical protein